MNYVTENVRIEILIWIFKRIVYNVYMIVRTDEIDTSLELAAYRGSRKPLYRTALTYDRTRCDMIVQ